MTAPASFSQRDLELISSFLDGTVTPKERRDFLSRLRQEPELRRAVAEIRMVREGLRGLPPIGVPRDFRLTKDLLAPLRPSQPQRSKYYTWGSAVAAMALALLFFFDLGSSSWLAARSVPAALPVASDHETPGQAPSVMQAQQNSLASPAAPLPITSPLAAERLSSPTPGSELPPARVAAPSAAPPTPEQRMGGGAPPSTPNAGSSPSPESPAPQTEAENLQPSAAVPAFKSQTNLPPQPLPSSPPTWTSIVPTSRPLLRSGEIILALVAAGLAIAAILSRRSRK
jgi:hypothetical protein